MERPIDRLGMGPEREIEKIGEFWLVTVTPPKWTGIEGKGQIFLNEDQYKRYKLWQQTGASIQNVFPDLTPSEREILLTGIT